MYGYRILMQGSGMAGSASRFRISGSSGILTPPEVLRGDLDVDRRGIVSVRDAQLTRGPLPAEFVLRELLDFVALDSDGELLRFVADFGLTDIQLVSDRAPSRSRLGLGSVDDIRNEVQRARRVAKHWLH